MLKKSLIIGLSVFTLLGFTINSIADTNTQESISAITAEETIFLDAYDFNTENAFEKGAYFVYTFWIDGVEDSMSNADIEKSASTQELNEALKRNAQKFSDCASYFCISKDTLLAVGNKATKTVYYGFDKDGKRIDLNISLKDKPQATESKAPVETKQSLNDSSSNNVPFEYEQALKKAYEYLNTSSFSASGLKKQLAYEGFTDEACTYAVNHCGADWNEQAVRKAREYLEVSSFSKKSLKEQLEFEGFSESEAQYAVNKVYK